MHNAHPENQRIAITNVLCFPILLAIFFQTWINIIDVKIDNNIAME